MLNNILCSFISRIFNSIYSLFYDLLYCCEYFVKYVTIIYFRIPVKVPTACVRFENELFYMPDSFLVYKYPNLVHISDYSDGGHFAAFELPDVMAKDIWTAITAIEKLHRQN